MNKIDEHILTSPIAEGRTAEVYRWDDGHILKLYHAWCPADWVTHEARVARTINAAGIPTPAAGEIVECAGRRGIIYERVAGVSMLADLRRRPWLIFRYGRTLADLQARFHRLAVPGVHAYGDELRRAIGRAPHLTEELRRRVLGALAALPDGAALCHGDFHPDNVLISPAGPVVIDWMTASLGDPWADVARTSMILTIGVKAAGKQAPPHLQLLTGFFHRTYLERYCALAPAGHDKLARWRPIIAAARLNEQITAETAALLRIVSGDGQ